MNAHIGRAEMLNILTKCNGKRDVWREPKYIAYFCVNKHLDRQLELVLALNCMY